ncbi:ABC1 kinase family protein [Novosphingobium piscinae]|uniref:AarF/ABC1/UbiB kinase family protein n=1 Tax=Novosphingobium piscinae TaxID=1507448 RepID=A0A7X1KNW4_9SPHN|nr:AarF/ABC1/UbiB kinase family protein [Novosphingobium piscinae]MBC2668111.1 AarF/ABC1/UbiB kinase family protein [Novosphingobium piscinae]
MTGERYRKVPSSRLSRLAGFGQLAGGIVGGMVAEGARRLASGDRPRLNDLLLTPGNAVRTAEQLSRLRGAAMKLGQMISLDAGDVLPAELTAILARLREAAHFMPPAQLNKVLTGEWGPTWRSRFARFDPTPIAAASIGQVHRATLPDGRIVAVKVQYPGIAASIDADVDNVATLLRLSGLLPAGLDVAPLLAEAKRQLHEEADYAREAEQMRRYATLLAGDPRFVVPAPVAELSSGRVLVMDFVPGQPIESLATADETARNAAAAALVELVLHEVLWFGLMQTDPNFANYRWQPETGRIVLLDFGAARPVPAATSAAYRGLLEAGLAEDRAALKATLLSAGFVAPQTLERHGAGLDGMIAVMIGHLGKPDPFDFADRSFVERLRQHVAPMMADRAAWHIPPADTLFVQRKVSGTALLAVRLRARFALRAMVGSLLAGPTLPPVALAAAPEADRVDPLPA